MTAILMRQINFLFFSFLFISCSTTRPCTEAGDTSWIYPLKGDAYCMQKELPDGTVVNHGEYYKKDLQGNVVLKGMFVNGKKQGTWVQYDEAGKKKVEKKFENGVEK